MQTSTRPESEAEKAAARRNYVIFGVASAIGITVLITVVTLLLV